MCWYTYVQRTDFLVVADFSAAMVAVMFEIRCSCMDRLAKFSLTVSDLSED